MSKKSKRQEVDFVVEDIIDHNLDKSFQLWYYVKWEGYDETEMTWEPAENTIGCGDVIKSYWARFNGNQKNTSIAKGSFGKNKTDDEKKFWAKYEPHLKKIGLNLIGTRVLSDGKIEAKVVNSDPEILEKERKIQLSELSQWERKINEECNKANEAILTVENNMNSEGPPKSFKYITNSVPGEDVTIPNDPVIYCHCEKDENGHWKCGNCKDCCPKLNDSQFAYAPQSGRSIKDRKVAIFECNSKCKCAAEPEKCPNRVVQRGRQIPLCIFKTVNRGWGVKTPKRIVRGSFVTEYVGEVITIKEAKAREASKDPNKHSYYLFDLDYGLSAEYSVDAKRQGNVAHFINHSCQPNLETRTVWVNCQQHNLPCLAFFAARDIHPNEELTFDYNPPKAEDLDASNLSDSCGDENDAVIPSPRKSSAKPLKCYCGAQNCRGTLFN